MCYKCFSARFVRLMGARRSHFLFVLVSPRLHMQFDPIVAQTRNSGSLVRFRHCSSISHHHQMTNVDTAVPDLFASFFRTRPSALSAVLPRVILSAAIAARDEHSPAVAAEVATAADADIPPRGIAARLREPLLRRGVEWCASTDRFRFLSSDVAEDPSRRTPITGELIDAAKRRVEEFVRQHSTVNTKHRRLTNAAEKNLLVFAQGKKPSAAATSVKRVARSESVRGTTVARPSVAAGAPTSDAASDVTDAAPSV